MPQLNNYWMQLNNGSVSKHSVLWKGNTLKKISDTTVQNKNYNLKDKNSRSDVVIILCTVDS